MNILRSTNDEGKTIEMIQLDAAEKAALKDSHEIAAKRYHAVGVTYDGVLRESALWGFLDVLREQGINGMLEYARTGKIINNGEEEK